MESEREKLHECIERFLRSDSQSRQRIVRTLAEAVDEAVKQGEGDFARLMLQHAIVGDLDYTVAMSLSRLCGRLRAQHWESERKRDARLSVAVLGTSTTKQLVTLLELYLFGLGVDVDIYEAEYGVAHQEILDPSSKLYAHRPRLVFLATSSRDLVHRPSYQDDAARVTACIRSEVESWLQLWAKAHDTLGCQIIQNNFEQPTWYALDNHEMRHPAGLGRYIACVNQALQDAAPQYVTIHDLERLAGSHGRLQWFEPRFYHEAKLPCAPECLPRYAHSVASVIAATLGVSRKCLVLDLDNTMWGGVVGDDGIEGLRLGQGSAEGEAFLAFQYYVRSLQQRGVLLAVCSKNDETIARRAFKEHPEMVVQHEEVSCFIANWVDKATNLREIAARLNIGLNALVFVDDNPAERALVRQFLPMVAVPELSADPSSYISAIDQGHYFQTVALEIEDLNRTAYYLADAARTSAQAVATDLVAYLRGLEMRARIRPIEAPTLARSTQLINKSNQFNLTTRRYSQADLVAISQDTSWIALTVSLRDRFGDNGLVSVLLARIDGDCLDVDTWVMSCRVLRRTVEQCLLNHLCQTARGKGLRRIRGVYIPTAKNSLVREHFPTLGFNRVDELTDELHSVWELSLTDELEPATCWIQEA